MPELINDTVLRLPRGGSVMHAFPSSLDPSPNWDLGVHIGRYLVGSTSCVPSRLQVLTFMLAFEDVKNIAGSKVRSFHPLYVQCVVTILYLTL
jgi:hypothetical protein